MNLEQKAFGVIWHTWSELRAIKDVICIGKLIHLHMLNRICLTNSLFGGGGDFALSKPGLRTPSH
jgi:hypothetical protein